MCSRGVASPHGFCSPGPSHTQSDRFLWDGRIQCSTAIATDPDTPAKSLMAAAYLNPAHLVYWIPKDTTTWSRTKGEDAKPGGVDNKAEMKSERVGGSRRTPRVATEEMGRVTKARPETNVAFWAREGRCCGAIISVDDIWRSWLKSLYVRWEMNWRIQKGNRTMACG